jgi:hypothetical protein
MKTKILFLVCCLLAAVHWTSAQSVFVPPGFQGPIYFDQKGQNIPVAEGAQLYRIYRLAGTEEQLKNTKIITQNGQQALAAKNSERNEYFYFEDYYLNGTVQSQGNIWVSKTHQEQGAGLNALKVHLKGICKWYHTSGQVAQVGIFDGADWYGDQRYYDAQGRLIKVEPGKPLSTYNYKFERSILNLPQFNYSDSENNILPLPQGMETEAEEEITLAPIDLAAKMSAMPRFTIKAYRAYLGVYLGKTINASLKKTANTSLDLIEVNVRKGEVILEIHWYGGFNAYAKLQGSISDNVIFARGDWMVKGEKAGILTLATFLKKEEGQLEGFFNIKPLGVEAKVQSCSFLLTKE